MTGPVTPTDQVAVIGAGTMGSGIAMVAAAAGHDVLLYDASLDALESGVAEIERRLRRDVERQRMSPPEAETIEARIRPLGSLGSLTEAAIVIEAIVENITVKQDLFADLEAIVSSDTILATNTSSLSVTAVAAAAAHPGRIVGMHFFNPAALMPLVEVVRGERTSATTLAATVGLATAWGKTPVVCESTPGFIVNRVARPFYGEALRLVAEGADPATIDTIVREAGDFRMGPFQLMDLVGLDVNLAVSTAVYEQTGNDPRFAPSDIQQALVAGGNLGRKSGRGFYDYADSVTPIEVASLQPAPISGPLTVAGDIGHAAGLVERLARHIEITTTAVGADDGHLGLGHLALGEVMVVPTKGTTASVLADTGPASIGDLVAIDLARDWRSAAGVAVARASGVQHNSINRVAGLLALAGVAAYEVSDTPGLVLMRIMAQLASVAADAAAEGVATPQDIDTAMRLGTNYPEGPFEWADAVGQDTVVTVLDNMREHYTEDRYLAAPSLRERRVAGRKGTREGDRDG